MLGEDAPRCREDELCAHVVNDVPRWGSSAKDGNLTTERSEAKDTQEGLLPSRWASSLTGNT